MLLPEDILSVARPFYFRARLHSLSRPLVITPHATED